MSKRAETVSLELPPPRISTVRLFTAELAQPVVIDLGDDPVVVGKSVTAAMRLRDPHVSHEHVQVELTLDGIVIEDLGSSNGTKVNGLPIRRVTVTEEVVVTLGTTDVRICIGSDEGTPTLEFGGVSTRSSAMKPVFALVQKLASAEINVLFYGETGTGKDVLASALHRQSSRAAGPLAVFDCGAVSPTLIESDLFGHQKGAFTGATDDRAGVFENAHCGTVFLDEIGELPIELQPRLLRVLEQRQVQRVGSGEVKPVDVRVIAATNRNLEQEVEAGRFRQDLYFRLSAAVVEIPPLRRRIEDLGDLVDQFLSELGLQLVVGSDTLEALRAYDWPGNIRELRNVVSSAAAVVDGSTLEPRHLMFFKPAHKKRASTLDKLPLGGRTLEAIEKAAIKQSIRKAEGNKAQAARTLGIAPSTLYQKIRKYGI